MRTFSCALGLLFLACAQHDVAATLKNVGLAELPFPPEALDGGACPELPPLPATALRPRAGELFYAQLGLGGLGMGESAVLIGPDGTVVLFDAANDSHDDDLASALAALNGSTALNHLVITHFHADHGDGVEALLARSTLDGRIVHRGFTDLTPAANEVTIDRVCAAVASHPGAGAALCTAATTAPCAAASRSGTYPAVRCDGFADAGLSLGADARVTFVAANGFIGTEQLPGSLRTDDSNGENARSVVALVGYGAFRMLLAGDLTGGGSDTDDLESFYAPRLPVPATGVDVLHAGHHGRNTSSNPTWLARLLPDDGRSRNALMGISAAHLGSPHPEVLSALLDGPRLREGRAWTTRVSTGGATHAKLIDARGGMVLLGTRNQGATYLMQAVDADGVVLESRAFRAISACP